ncbi:MAG: phage major capsid protein [Mycobacterium sp.]|nr:MAG: phage major capsid protein [Mycobacterium sp.]
MADNTTTTAAQVWRPDANVFAATDVLADAAIMTHSTVSAHLEGDAPVMRVGYVSDASAVYHTEGTAITPTDPALNEIECLTQEIAFLHAMTRDQYRQKNTAEQLAQSVSRSIIKQADKCFLSQPNPVSPAVRPVGGLENYPGITTQTAVSGSLDKLIDLDADVRSAGAEPTAWLMAPDAWALIRKMKQATGSNVGILGAGTEDSVARLLSVPVFLNSQMSSKTGLLIDKDEVVSTVSGLEVDVSHDTLFSSVQVAIRGTWRIGYGVPRPNRIGKFVLS